MLKRRDKAGVVIGRSLCMGSLLLAGLAHADAEPVAASTEPAAADAGPAAAAPLKPTVKVVSGSSADAIMITQLLDTAISKLDGAPRTLDEVNRWSDALTLALRQGGFPIGQVLMTEDDWQATRKGAQAQFTAFPGRISRITLKNTSRVKDARLTRLIHHAMCGSDSVGGACLLRTSRLERTTQLLQDVPGVALDGAPQISPGAGTGDVDVTFNIVQLGKMAKADLLVDNNGIESTGQYRFGVTASANNVFGQGEDYALTVMDTNKNMWTGSVSASMPIFDDGLRMTAGYTRQQYSINAGTPLTGVSNVIQTGIAYPFARGLDRNVWGSVSYVHNQSSTDFTDFGGSSQSNKLNAVQLSLRADNGDRARQLRSDMWSAQTALTVGHQSNNSFANSDAHISGDYAKLTGSGFGTYGLSKSGNLFMSARINSQISNRNLDPSEKLSIGGANAVRAYRNDEGSVDEGMVFNLGLYQRVPVATGHQLQFGVFTDVAWGRVNHSPWDGWQNTYPAGVDVKNIRTLAGYGAGVDWLTPFGAVVSASVAKPYGFSSASWIDPGSKKPQVWLSVTWGH